MRLLRWFADHFIGTTLTLLVLLAGSAAFAATSYDVFAEPQMNLDVSITGTQTSGIIIASPQRNGANHTFATTTGGILRIRWGAYQEDVYYASASRNATTNKVTLAGVVRNLCPQQTRTFLSCGAGRSWGKGAIVELTVSAQNLNLKASADRANTFTASGSVAFSGSGSLAFPTFATTAARDQALGATPGGPVRAACVTATGLCYLYYGGAWTAIGSSATPNADAATAGKAELGTVSDLSGATVLGDSGAPVFVPANLVIRHSTGAINARNKAVATNNTGYLSGSLLPQLPLNKFNSATNATSATFWRGDGTWASLPRVLYSASSGSNLISNTTSETDFNRIVTLTGSTVASGGTIRIYASGVHRNVGSGNPVFRIYYGANVVATLTGVTLGLAPAQFEINASIQVRRNQTLGEVQANSSMLFFPHNNIPAIQFNPVKVSAVNKANISTIGQAVKISGQMGGTDPGTNLRLDQFRVEYLPPVN